MLLLNGGHYHGVSIIIIIRVYLRHHHLFTFLITNNHCGYC